MIDLPAEQLEVVKGILKKWVPSARVVVFGSRVKGSAKTFSDLDLAIQSNTELTPKVLALLKNDFSESNLPIKVDIVDWHSIDDNFKNVILEKNEPITF